MYTRGTMVCMHDRQQYTQMMHPHGLLHANILCPTLSPTHHSISTPICNQLLAGFPQPTQLIARGVSFPSLQSSTYMIKSSVSAEMTRPQTNRPVALSPYSPLSSVRIGLSRSPLCVFPLTMSSPLEHCLVYFKVASALHCALTRIEVQ